MIKIPIDPTNPGHVFAAVGLTELAYRITGEATGHFDNLTYVLRLGGNVSIRELVSRIKKLELTAKNTKDVNTPISLDGLRLDWWLRDVAKDTKAGNIKGWAGRMNIFVITSATKDSLSDKESLLFERSLTKSINKKEAPALTSFDAQRARSTLDTGYSPDKLNHKIMPAPSVEFLAMIGLQRAWPTKINGSYTYYTWSSPLPPILIPAAITGYIDPITGYSFAIKTDGDVSRVQPAQPFHQNNKL